jgi:hypothetical protein
MNYHWARKVCKRERVILSKRRLSGMRILIVIGTLRVEFSVSPRSDEVFLNGEIK